MFDGKSRQSDCNIHSSRPANIVQLLPRGSKATNEQTVLLAWHIALRSLRINGIRVSAGDFNRLSFTSHFGSGLTQAISNLAGLGVFRRQRF